MAAKTKTDMFSFTHDGVTIELPPAKDIPAGVTRKVRKLDSIDQLFTTLETVADEDTLAVIDSWPSGVAADMMVAWMGADGASAGESSAS